MAKKVTTLFLRDSSINAAVMDGMRVEKWASAPIEPGLVVNGLITDEAKAAAAIKELFKQNSLRGGKVIAGLSGVNSLYRMITLPDMPDALLAEAVRREAGRVLPISLDEVYLSYQAVPAVSRGERRLFLATYPKGSTDALVRTARSAGLDPYMMDLAPLALSRIPDEPRCVIVSSRPNHADIVVVEDRIPQLIRVLSLPSEATSLAERLPAISEELNRTIVFYNSSHAEKPLNETVPLFVGGELSESEQTWPQLVGRLRFPVSNLPSPMEAPAEFPADEFAVNVGLALKDLAAERGGTNFSTVNLNVLPETYQPRKVRLTWVASPVLGVAAVAVIAYVASMSYAAAGDVKELKETAGRTAPAIAEQTRNITDLKAKLAEVTPLSAPADSQVSQIRATAAVFGTTMTDLQSNRARVNEDLKARVIAMLPLNKANLGLMSVAHDGSTVIVAGSAADEDFVFEYARKLRESGGVASVLVTSVQAQQDEAGGTTRYEFSLVVR